MAGITLGWTITPSRAFGRKIGSLATKGQKAAADLARATAARGEGLMKTGAEWEDQTGYARGALYGRAEGTTIELGTVNREYGPFLELGTSRMAPRPIILPTAQQLAPEYFEDCAAIFEGILGGGA